MANDLTTLLPKILARGLSVLRERCAITQYVNFNYDGKATEKGDQIVVPVSSARTSSDVTPGPVPSNAQDSAMDQVIVPIDQWKHADFQLTDRELTRIAMERDFFPLQAQEAVKSLANTFNEYIWNLYPQVGGFVGTAGTTPFGSTPADAINARKVLHRQLCPRTDRAGILDLDAEAAALALSAFQDVDKAGDTSTKREGEIGRKFGINWMSDDYVPTHVSGAASGYLANGGAAVGAKTVTIDTGSGAFNVGDIVTFAGHPATDSYAVVSSVGGASATQITLSTPLRVAVADNAALGFKADHVVNMAFHRDAFAVVMRPLATAGDNPDIVSMQDPLTGLTMRLERIRGYKQTMFDFDILYGGKIVRPEYAVRIAG